MAGHTALDILTLIIAGIFTFIAVLVGGVSLYLVHVYRKYEHIPSPPRSGILEFFLGHAPVIHKVRKREGFFAAVCLKWCEELGDTFILIILGTPMLVTINQDAVKELLVTTHNPKSTRAYASIRNLFGERFVGRGLVTELDHDIWTKRRSLLNPAFHRQLLKTLMDDFNDTADDLMTSLAERADGKSYIALLGELNRVTLDVIAKVGFGMEINSIKEPSSPFPKAIFLVFKGLSQSVKSHFRRHIPFLDRKFKNEVCEALRFLRKTGQDVLNERQRALAAGEIVPTDILSFVLEAKKADPSINEETFLDDFVTFFLAGQETTANALAFLIRELGRNPAVLNRVRNEVDAVIGERNSVTFEDINKLEYCSLVIRETLRLFPPVPFTFRDLNNDHKIGGYNFPKGTTVLLNTYAASRYSKSGTKDVLTFDPDRYLTDSPRRPPTYTYFPFSLGPRSCIGITFAQIEAKLILAKFIQRFEFFLDPNQSFDIEENTTLRAKDGTRVALKLRDN